jgi:hypothetical protein
MNLQTLLIVVVVSLTLLLLVVGIQVLMVILDLRRAVSRLNNLLGDALIGGGLIDTDKLTGIVEMVGRKKKMETHGESRL